MQALQENTEGLPETVAVARRQPGPNGRLLVVEDARCIQMLVGSLLRAMNLEADMAGDGQVACEMAMQSQAEGHPYDVILMDDQMPKMDGKQAVKWLRESGWKGPILAVSIHSTAKGRAALLAAGCDGFLSKPVTQASLRDALAEYIESA